MAVLFILLKLFCKLFFIEKEATSNTFQNDFTRKKKCKLMSDSSCRTAAPNLTYPLIIIIKGCVRFKSNAILNNIHFQKTIRGYPHLIFYICRYVSTRRLGTAVVKEETCCEWPFERFFFRVNRPNLLLFHVVKVKGKKKTFPLTQTCFWSLKQNQNFWEGRTTRILVTTT